MDEFCPSKTMEIAIPVCRVSELSPNGHAAMRSALAEAMPPEIGRNPRFSLSPNGQLVLTVETGEIPAFAAKMPGGTEKVIKIRCNQVERIAKAVFCGIKSAERIATSFL